MKRIATLLMLVLLGAAPPASAREELVLIVSAHSRVSELDSSKVRKLFLGLTVVQGTSRLRPVINDSDPQIRELFLQNIVSMSDATYDRYVLRLSLMRGQTPPAIYKSSTQLIDAVAADPDLVGYAWAHEIAHDARIRMLRVLWHD